ncbi:MAG: TonB-dependent receptor plug domain-containing protein [Cyclobacteriaceae bacterium]
MRILWVSLFLFTIYNCHAQEQKDMRSLKEVIPFFENQYDVNFSYADSLILDKRVESDIQKNQSVADVLSHLERETGLRFEFIREGYIVIRPFRAIDKIDVCGYVYSKNNLPLAGAAVVSGDSTLGFVTDSLGYFFIKDIVYNTMLNIQHLGYSQEEVKASDLFLRECPIHFLEDSVYSLSQVTISDYLTAGISKRNLVIEILPNQLKLLPGLIEPDILLSIQQSPGVNSPYETASGIFVRGGTPDLNLVTWNGIKTYSQGHFFGMISSFNPYITEKITFIKSGTSARYGDRVSAVIDIKSNDEVADRTSGGAGVNLIYGEANIEIPVVSRVLSMQVAGRRSFNDYISTPTYNRYSDRVFQNTKIAETLHSGNQQTDNDFFFTDYTTKIIYQPDVRNRFMFNSLYNKNDLDFANSDQDQRLNDILKTENEGYGLSWEQENSDRKIQMGAESYLTRYLFNYEFRNTQNDTTEVASKQNFVMDYGVNLHSKFALTRKSSLLLGYQFSNNQINYSFTNTTPSYSLILDDGDLKMQTHSAYSEIELDTRLTRIVAGLRYNRYAEFGRSYLEPRLSVQHAISEHLKVNASVEFRSQAVSQIQESVVSDLSLENQLWTLSSDGKFPIIRSNQLTLGFSYAAGTWLIDLDTYLKNIQGITTRTFGFLNPVDNEYRIGESDIKGVDFFIKKTAGSYKTWLGYSYLFTENMFLGLNENESFPGNWNIEHTIKWSHFYKLKNLHLSIGWQWHTGKAFTEVMAIPNTSGPVTIQFDGINEANLPVYHRLDVSALYEFHPKNNTRIRYRTGLSIFNIYNRKNLINREFRTTPSLQNELIDTRVVALGFTPNIVFRVFW